MNGKNKFLFCFILLLNGQGDLKLDVFSQMKVKELQSGTLLKHFQQNLIKTITKQSFEAF